jgi:hypothetical protein
MSFHNVITCRIFIILNNEFLCSILTNSFSYKYRAQNKERYNKSALFGVQLNGLWRYSKLNSVALVRGRTMPTERPPLVGEVMPTFGDRRCWLFSATDSHGR